MKITEPMKATSKTIDPKDAKQLEVVKRHLPLYASYKLDGIRCVVQDCSALSRTMKQIPNRHIYHTLSGSQHAQGLDGELIVGDPTDPLCMNKTTSAVMRRDGTPDFTFYVFDKPNTEDFSQRLASMVPVKPYPPYIKVLKQVLCRTWEEVLAFEARAVDLGYEGIILRRPDGPYKQGRATLKEGYALKFKRMEDSEAVIIGMVELRHNLNEQELKEDGKLKRSHRKEGMVGGGTLGALQVRDIHTGVEFEIGTFKGFDATWKQGMWDNRASIIKSKTVVSYKFFPVGVKEKPRHPVLKGVRWKGDL